MHTYDVSPGALGGAASISILTSCLPVHNDISLDVFSRPTLIINTKSKSAVVSCCSISFLYALFVVLVSSRPNPGDVVFVMVMTLFCLVSPLGNPETFVGALPAESLLLGNCTKCLALATGRQVMILGMNH